MLMDRVHDTQEVFRMTLDCMAKPGEIQEMMYISEPPVVSPKSNNAYKQITLPCKIEISIQGGVFLMSQEKLTIVPVTLHSSNQKTLASTSSPSLAQSICTIKTAYAEVSFYSGVEEHIVRTIMRELKNS